MPADPPLLSPPGRVRPKPGIVHLGLGAFFRAHGAMYVSEAMACSGGDWGIIGVSLVRPSQRDLLAPQGFAYTAVELNPDGDMPQVIDVVQNVLVAREDPQAVLAAMADPTTRIVTLTVTEKGYCHEPSTGALNFDHPDIVHDLEDSATPRSAPGYLVRALERRRALGLPAFTVLCCDNLPENGTLVRRVVRALARQIDTGLADWIERNGAFPCTMVDRIVPATKAEDIERVMRLTGILDRSPVMHEPFRQWVIEDGFVNGDRPDLPAVGVQLVADVRPYEHMKLRCLNGTHSSLAYLGYLAGYETVSDTVSDPVFTTFLRHLWRKEIIPGLTPPDGEDLEAYTEKLLERYANPAIRHLTWQIAMDGSQKLPQRILGAIQENLAAERMTDGLILAVAAWMRYVGGQDESGRPIDVRDPLAERFRSLLDNAVEPRDKVDSLLALREVFPAALAMNDDFQNRLVIAYQALMVDGARAGVVRIGQ